MALTKITNSAIADDIGLGGNPTTSTQTAGNSTTRIATTAFVSTAVANLVDSAPDTLNTLAELATSIGNNATLSSTLTTSIATKLPLAGGTLTGNLNLGDNVRTRFGLDSDLQIYHNSSNNNSYIDESGTGDLYVRANNVWFQNTGPTATFAKFTNGGAVELRHNDGIKFATTATGIDVTGDVVNTGGLYSTVNNSLKIIGGGNASNAGSNLTLYGGTNASAGTFRFRNGTSVLATIDATGIDVTGNIGVTGTVDGIDIAARDAVLTSTTTTAGAALPKAGGTISASGDTPLIINTTNSNGPHMRFQVSGSNKHFIGSGTGIGGMGDADDLALRAYDNIFFGTGDSSTIRLTIDSVGSVGIGNTPSTWASSVYDALQIGGGIGVGAIAGRRDGINQVNFGLNWHYASGATLSYVGSSFATNYAQEAGTHRWFHASSGTAAAALTFTESMRIDSSGNVGIGTDDPDARLGIKSSGASTYPLLIKSSDNQQLFRFREESDTRGTFYINDASENSKVTLASSGNSSFMGGNVGIGTTDTYSRKFVVEGTGDLMMLRSTNAGAGGAQLDFIHDSASAATGDSVGIINFSDDAKQYASLKGVTNNINVSGQLHFGVRTDASNYNHDAMVIDNTGNVGIGTTTPDSPLEISGADDTRLKLTDTGDSSELMLRSDGVNTQIYTNTAHDLGIYTSGNLGQLHLKQSNGNVGIGVASPNQPLEVNGNIGFSKGTNAERYLLVEGADATWAGDVNIQAGFGSTAAGGGVKLYGHAHGTYPGSVWIGRSAGAAGNIMFGNGGTGPTSASQIQMVISSGGNVGIGTTVPAHKLSVTDTRSGFHFPVAIGGGTHLAGSGVGIAFDPEGYQAEGYVHNALVIAGAGYGWNRGDFHFLMNHVAADNQTTNLTHSRLVIKSDTGNVGIGTITPQETIHAMASGNSAIRVSGGANNNKKTEIGYNTSTGPYVKGGSSGITTLQFYVDNTSLAMTIASNDVISGDFNDTSDVGLKENITDLGNSTDIINALKPRTFDWKKASKENGVPGFIAQEVEIVIPKAVTGTDYKNVGDTGKAINSTAVLAHAIKAIQEQQTLIESLTARITALEG